MVITRVEQLGLFNESKRVIVDDAHGSIVYYPNAITPERAHELFLALKRDLDWRSERRMMYDREVDVPRLVASLPVDATLPAELAGVLPVVEGLSGNTFTRIGFNLYRDGNDSVAAHNDRTNELETGAPIALLSLGAVRRMTIRSKDRPRRILDLDLAPGSLLVMSYATQFSYDHAIPKTHLPMQPRISVAFRRSAL